MPSGAVTPAGSRSEEDVGRAGLAVQSWNVHPYSAASANTAPTSQTIYAVSVPYRAGQVVTRIGWVVLVAAVGTTPTGIFCGLCSATTMLMDSANLAASTAWTTAGLRTVALSSPFTITADGLYYHLILQNGAFGTTQPTLNRLSNPGGVQIDGAGTMWFATAGVAQTALPAVNAAVTLASSGTPLPFITFST